MTTSSQTLTAAAHAAAAWPVPFSGALAQLLDTESEHAARLEAEDCDWDRYPPGSLLVALAKGVLEHDEQRRPGVRICNNADRHAEPCDCGSRR